MQSAYDIAQTRKRARSIRVRRFHAATAKLRQARRLELA